MLSFPSFNLTAHRHTPGQVRRTGWDGRKNSVRTVVRIEDFLRAGVLSSMSAKPDEPTLRLEGEIRAAQFIAQRPVWDDIGIYGGTSAGAQPQTYIHVGLVHGCPHQLCAISTDHPPCASVPQSGRGSPHAAHRRLAAGCSSTPPHRRTCSTAHGPSSFSPGSGFAMWLNRPQLRHGGCATTGQPPGHVRASLSRS
jgi:hypothetical protein